MCLDKVDAVQCCLGCICSAESRSKVVPRRGDRGEDTGGWVLGLALLMLTEPANAKAIAVQIAISLQPQVVLSRCKTFFQH